MAVAGIAAGVVVGGTVAVVAPAVATQDTSYAATNWKKVWNDDLEQYAAKTFYTKKKSDSATTRRPRPTGSTPTAGAGRTRSTPPPESSYSQGRVGLRQYAPTRAYIRGRRSAAASPPVGSIELADVRVGTCRPSTTNSARCTSAGAPAPRSGTTRGYVCGFSGPPRATRCSTVTTWRPVTSSRWRISHAGAGQPRLSGPCCAAPTGPCRRRLPGTSPERRSSRELTVESRCD